jgi:hypothetical protein
MVFTLGAGMSAAVGKEGDVRGQAQGGGSDAPTATSAASSGSFLFDKAFELELKSVQARRLLMKGERDPKAYFTEEYRARVGAALKRGPFEALPTQFNFANLPGNGGEFLFARRYSPGEPITEADGLNLTGLCMSGGGIRSAAVNLGVTQALDALSPGGHSDVIDSLDYLSTVSGGNYIGTSIAAGMMQPPDAARALPLSRYPYETKTDGSETPETQHLRDYSSYLTPNGFSDVVANLLIVARGLVANTVMFMGALLLLAWVQLLLTPTTEFLAKPRSLALAERFLPEGVAWPAWAGGFVVSLVLAGFILGSMLVWTCLKRWLSYRSGLSSRERIGGGMIVLTGAALLAAFVEWQPAILAAMRSLPPPSAQGGGASADLLTQLFSFLGKAGVAFGSAAAAMLALGAKLIKIVKAATGDASWTGKAKRYAGKALLVILGVSVPILLWIVFLNLVHAGICDWSPDGKAERCTLEAPGWVAALGGKLALWTAPGANPVIWVYFWGALACLAATTLFSPNANTLHQLYRDRLSRAFLLERAVVRSGVRRRRPARDPVTGERLPEPDDYTFSSLKLEGDRETPKPSGAWAPYLLVNTAINLQADYLRQRGRKADTFTLGPLVSGSDATGYVKTVDLEDRHPRLTLASGLAISGAAASANMGGNTIPVITFSLAALNVRLGYWLPNPARLDTFAPGARKADGQPAQPPWKRQENGFGNWYFMRELFSWIGPTSRRIYLTDGGHIENLGLYELTKRRCRVIIAVDAEADQGMVFPSLVKAQLMMRIDHGVRLELPWPEISAACKQANAKIGTAEEASLSTKSGPHVAVGRIIYRDNPPKGPDGSAVAGSDADAAQGERVHGVLIYIKASMTGDENDSIRDYKRRNGDFPHETTLDQFFSEEQFEVYRALGFHMTHRFFTGRDDAAFWTPDDAPRRDEFFQDVENALTSIAVPAKDVAAIMKRARENAEKADRLRKTVTSREPILPVPPVVAAQPVPPTHGNATSSPPPPDVAPRAPRKAAGRSIKRKITKAPAGG